MNLCAEKEVYLQGFSGSNELDLPLPYKSGGGGGSGGVVSQLTSRHPNLPSAAEHDREGVSSPRHVSRSQHHGVAVSAAVKGRNKHRSDGLSCCLRLSVCLSLCLSLSV